jgi:uncharacterized membrane protein YphA (DoxX/SURF4 family)
MTWQPDPAVQAALRLALAAVFAAAAAHKLRDRQGFRAALAGYALAPARAEAAAAGLLPALELLAAAALITPATAPAGAVLAGALLLVYTGAVAVSLARGRRAIACGCGGPAGDRTLGADLLARNAVLVAAALACAAEPAPRALHGLDAVTIAAGAAALALVYAAAETALANARAPAPLRRTP